MCLHASFLLHQSLGYVIKLIKLEALSNSYFMLYLPDLFLPQANIYMLQNTQCLRQNAVCCTYKKDSNNKEVLELA